jgi:hypothetical protein
MLRTKSSKVSNMKRNYTEHSKELKKKTSKQWRSSKLSNGAITIQAIIKDADLAEFARQNINNKTEFIINAVKELYKKFNEKQKK